MSITIKVDNSDPFIVQFNPESLVKFLKEKIESERGILAKDQTLKIDGQLLDDGKPLSAYDFKKTLQLTSRIIQFFVRNKKTGSAIQIKAHVSSSLQEIRQKIEDGLGIPAGNQILSYGSRKLRNHRTLSYYYVKDDDTILLEESESKSQVLNLKTVGGSAYNLELFPSETVRDAKLALKEMLQVAEERIKLIFDQKLLENYQILEDIGFQAESSIHLLIDEATTATTTTTSSVNIEIFVKTESGAVESFEIDDSIPIEKFKEEVKATLGIKKTVTLYTEDEVPLKDGKVLSDYNVTDGEILYLKETEDGPTSDTKGEEMITLTIKITGQEQLSVPIAPTSTVRELKEKLRELSGLPAGITLVFQQDALLDSKRIDEYDIAAATTIHLVLPVESKETEIETESSLQEVFINTVDGNQSSILVDLKSTVKDLKEQISTKVGISSANQMMTYEGTVLEDRKRLSEYGIEEFGTIFCIKKPFIDVRLKTLFGNINESLCLATSDQIRKIKEGIQEKTELKCGHQKLICNKTLLEDDRFASDYGISEGSDIYVINTEDAHYFWKNSEGKVFVFGADPSTSTKNIRRFIKENKGVFVKELGPISTIFKGISEDIEKVLKPVDGSTDCPSHYVF